MIIVMKPNAAKSSIDNVLSIITDAGLTPHLSEGSQITIIGVVGDQSKLINKNIELAKEVEKIVPVTESYKLANKKFHPTPSIIQVGNTSIGGNEFVIMSGPCAVENESQVLETAIAIKKSGAQILRGGAYKPRTSPYSFQGLEEDGLKLMKEARDETGLSIVCEVTSLEAIETAAKYVDMIQIGARNMQNFYLLKEAGKSGLPVLLKRGLSATIDEWLKDRKSVV